MTSDVSKLSSSFRCERAVDGKRCNHRAVAFAMGQHVCPAHLPVIDSACSHSLAPSGRCAYCGGSTAN
jgi:hypothetical protein